MIKNGLRLKHYVFEAESIVILERLRRLKTGADRRAPEIEMGLYLMFHLKRELY